MIADQSATRSSPDRSRRGRNGNHLTDELRGKEKRIGRLRDKEGRGEGGGRIVWVEKLGEGEGGRSKKEKVRDK